MLRGSFHLICYFAIAILFIPSLGFAAVMRGELPEVTITRVDTAPKIDGKINDDTWVQVARSFSGVLSGWKNLWGDKLISNPRIAYLAYDDKNLYIAMVAFVGDTSELIKQAWDSDGLEIHLDVGNSYFQLGIMFDGEKKMGSSSSSILYNTATYLDDYYWSVEVSIPWNELGIEPLQGTELRFNLAGWDYRNGWITWGPSYDNFLDRHTYGYLVLH